MALKCQHVRPAAIGLANAVPTTPGAVRVVASPPAHLLPVLDALLRGQTDVAASRRLNMSPRTFSRRVAELLDYLGVETRFQGGVKIALSGWVPGANGVSPSPKREIIAAWERPEEFAARWH